MSLSSAINDLLGNMTFGEAQKRTLNLYMELQAEGSNWALTVLDRANDLGSWICIDQGGDDIGIAPGGLGCYRPGQELTYEWRVKQENFAKMLRANGVDATGLAPSEEKFEVPDLPVPVIAGLTGGVLLLLAVLAYLFGMSRR